MNNKTTTADQTTFVEWAKENAVPITSVDPTNQSDNSDLHAIASAIGEDVEIVALSEGCHNSKQMMSLHHRIVKYLISHCGFTIVATESGLPESKLVFDYVQNNEEVDNVETVYKEGLNKMYSQWKEGCDLIEWLRKYNQDHQNKMVHYYGIDIGGFYQNWKNPMDQICQYLEIVDPKFALTLTEQLEPFINVMTENARVNYNEKLSSLDRAQLAILLDGAVEHFNIHRNDYILKSNLSDFEWARQSMISMQLAENYYRNILDIKSSKYPKFSGIFLIEFCR